MINEIQLQLTPPVPFSFSGTVGSHGWVDLLPNAWDAETKSMRRVEKLSSGKVVKLIIFEECKEEVTPVIGVNVESQGILLEHEITEIRTRVSDMLRLDEDLSEFYSLCARRGAPWDKITKGLGRMLRAPTFFEDVVKTICTTNVQWGGTKGMVKRLVEVYGEPYPNDETMHTFPSPEIIATAPFDDFHGYVRMGYRSDYVHLLSKRIASGELDLESIKTSSLPTSELKKQLLSIKGVGNYAAANLLMLIGRYDELAIDSIFRTYMRERYFKGVLPSDKEAALIYDDWGKWKYLAYWFEIWEYYNNQSPPQSEQSS
ncbi:MAG: DNA-3-methyladenine glycosylase 2 family protein [Anaerolineales bacterium]|nr:DNA-3-methyladenine glycosylase 2 family protein [Anaerolineales bacterium]